MLITRKSILTQIERTIDLPITQLQLDQWTLGGLTQVVFPELTASQREFIMTGITDEEWPKSKEDEEDDIAWDTFVKQQFKEAHDTTLCVSCKGRKIIPNGDLCDFCN